MAIWEKMASWGHFWNVGRGKLQKAKIMIFPIA